MILFRKKILHVFNNNKIVLGDDFLLSIELANELYLYAIAHSVYIVSATIKL